MESHSPRTVRAVRFHEYGPPEVLRLDEVPEPVAAPGTVRIVTEAVSVNPIDWKLRGGALSEVLPLELPVVPGRDAAGRVDQIGDGVEGFAPGDLVFGVGTSADTYTERAVLQAWARVPDGWTAAQAASAGLASTTALPALAALGPLEGRTLLVEGASGAVGAAAVAFAVDRGATVIGTASARDQDWLASTGAVATTYGPGLAERVEALAPDGVDLALDCAGSGSLPELVEIVGSAEHVVTVTDGQRSGPLGVRFVSAQNDAAMLAAAADLGARGGYTPRVAVELPAHEAAEAHRRAEQGGTGGKIVLTW